MDTGEHHGHGGFEFSPILIGLLGIIAGAMTVATYHCISIGCCYYGRNIIDAADQNDSINTSSQSIINQARPSNNSSSSSISFPVLRYSKECNEGTCAVCLSEFNEGEQIRVLPECLHLFHVPCIDMWLRSHSNCPLCRADTVLSPHVVVSLPDSSGAGQRDLNRLPDFGV